MKTGFAMVFAVMSAMMACSTQDMGTGLNTVERDYSKPASESWEAAMSTVKSNNLRIESDKHDALGGELLARRADNSEVRIYVKSVDRDNSRVSVRVGGGDSTLASVLQEGIASKLGFGEAKGGWFGGNSLSSEYKVRLQEGVAAARRSCGSLNLSITSDQTHTAHAQIDARKKDSTPVRFTIESNGDDGITVTFFAGTSKNEENESFIQRMKTEFERTMPRPGGSK